MSGIEGFSSIEEVLAIQNELGSIIKGPSSFQGTQDDIHVTSEEALREYLNAILNQEIEDLDKLIEMNKAKEERLFQFFGSDLKEGYLNFKAKLESWNSGGFSRILDDQKLIDKINQAIYDAELEIRLKDLNDYIQNGNFITKEELINMFFAETDQEKKDQSIVRNLFQESFSDVVKVAVERFNNSSKGNGTIKFSMELDLPFSFLEGGTFLHLHGKHTLGITIYKPSTSNKIIDLRFTGDMSKREKDKLTNRIEDFLKKHNGTISGKRTDKMYEEIESLIFNALPRESFLKAALVKTAFKRNVVINNNIALTKSYSGVKGMLGEVYWTAFLNYCFYSLKSFVINDNYNKGNLIDAVGVQLKDTKGKEIPVDLILNEIGFQVKNYNTDRGVISFHKSKEGDIYVPRKVTLEQFLTNRSELDNVVDQQIIGQFLFSEQYNRVLDTEEARTTYGRVYERFSPIRQGMELYFSTATSKLLNLEKDIDLDSKSKDLFDTRYTFPQPDVGKPTIYIIKDRVYSVSTMLEAIKKDIQNRIIGGGYNNAVSIKIENFSINYSGWDPKIYYNKTEGVNPTETIKQGFKETKVQYSIEIDLEKLTDILNNTTYLN